MVSRRVKLNDRESQNRTAFQLTISLQPGECFSEQVTRLIEFTSAPVTKCKFNLCFFDFLLVVERLGDADAFADQVLGSLLGAGNLSLTAYCARNDSGPQKDFGTDT